MNLKENIEQMVKGWEVLGHHALLNRFVLRNGKAFTPRKRIGRKGPAKQCFMNAHKFVAKSHDDNVRYVEGYVMSDALPMPIHHAWVSINGDDAMDPTLDSNDREYFGVSFTREEMWKASLANRYYGLFDSGFGLNTKLMFAIDPELEAIVRAIKPKTNEEILKGFANEKVA